MERFLEGQSAIVTGATKGIGRAVAEGLLDAGASVAICGRSAPEVERAVAALQEHASGDSRAIGAKCDVGNADDVRSLFEFVDKNFGALDTLVNNAGVGVFKPMGDLSIDEWQRTMDTNLSGVFYCSREALPRFRARGAGYIINMSSLAGRNPFAGGSAYNASKFGLNGLTEAMMLDYRYESVRVSYIMPGSVDTQFGGGAESAGWKISPSDIAEIVLSLLRMPARTLVSRVEVRPAKPKR